MLTAEIVLPARPLTELNPGGVGSKLSAKKTNSDWGNCAQTHRCGTGLIKLYSTAHDSTSDTSPLR
jgi:hypothetical protein